MADQPRYEPLEGSRFFADGLSARHPVPGTVARGQLRDDPHFFAGRPADAPPAEKVPSLDKAGEYVTTFPARVTDDLLGRGRERYGIYCAVCHDAEGIGAGPVVRHGFPPAQSFHTDRLRQAPVGYLFDVATRGYGKMPAYGNQIPPADRWAVVAYVRALQLGRDVRLPARDDAGGRTADGDRVIPTDAGSGRPVRPGGGTPAVDQPR